MVRIYTTIMTAAVMMVTVLCANGAQARVEKGNWPNWYLGVHGQMAFVRDADVSLPGVAGGELSYDSEYAVGGAIGFRPYRSNSVLDNMRFEAEYSYRAQDLDELSGTVGGVSSTTKLSGDMTGHTLMANAFYDFRNDTGFTPYLGAGIGAAFLSLDSAAAGVDDEDTVFAYQGMLGVYYSPETLPNTDWGVGYRYFATQDPEFNVDTGGTAETEYSSHNLEFLAHFRF